MKIYGDPGEIIRVHSQGEFGVVCCETPTTGHLWEAKFDSEFLSLLHKERSSPPPGEPRPGAAVNVTFSFRALKPTDTNIEMIRKRPWESEVKEKTVFRVQIV